MSENKELCVIVIKKIVNEQRGGNPLAENEKNYVISRIKKINLDLFKNQPIQLIVDSLVDLISAELMKLPKITIDNTPIDIHDILAKEIGTEPETALYEKKIDKNATVDSLLQTPAILQGIFNPLARMRKAYLILDRKYQSDESNNVNEFKWLISNVGKAHNPLHTAVSSTIINDVIGVKMFPFRFPNSENNITDFHRVSVEIVEFNSQAYIIAASNKRFHFLFDLQRTGAVGSTAPYNMNDIGNHVADFSFVDPIIEVNTMTVRFGNPEEIISLDPDSLYGTIAALGAQTEITFLQPHNCAVDDVIIIQGFNTTDPVADAAEITLLNDPYGWNIAAHGTFDMLINVDISGLTGAIAGGPFYVYLNSKRFMLRLELTYINK
jgi:hypothetical protein